MCRFQQDGPESEGINRLVDVWVLAPDSNATLAIAVRALDRALRV